MNGMKRFRLLLVLAAVLLASLSFTVHSVQAEDATAKPTTAATPLFPSYTDPVTTIQNIYKFSLILAGLLAFGMVSYAGIRYALSGGNPTARSDAMDQLQQAALGLLLLFGAYIILNTIDPNLTRLRLPTLEGIKGDPAEQGGKTLGCYKIINLGKNVRRKLICGAPGQECAKVSDCGGKCVDIPDTKKCGTEESPN